MNQSAYAKNSWSFRDYALAIFALLFFVGSLWFYLVLDWRVQSIDTGFSPEARRYQFLAAQQFLEMNSINSEQRNTLSAILTLGTDQSEIGDQDTIILVDSYGALFGERVDSLMDWVGNGGTLIHSTRNQLFDNDSDIGDSVFALLETGVAQSQAPGYLAYNSFFQDSGLVIEYDETQEGQGMSNEEELSQTMEDVFEVFDRTSEDSCFEEAPLTTWGTVNSTNEDVSVQLLGRQFLVIDPQQENNWYIDDQRGIQLLSRPWGDGHVILTTDNQLWSNNRIGCYDHAFLLSNFASNEGKVWFLVNRDSDSLLLILWRNFNLAITILGLCLVAWLWKKWVRFGPIRDDWDVERRSLLEHTDAAANFDFRRGSASALINELQNEIVKRLVLRRRGFKRLDVKHQIEVIQELTQLPEAIIAIALRSSAKLDEREFIRQVRACQKIRMRL